MPTASDFRPCLDCQMPEFDHGDGSPTDHPFRPDPDWQPEEERLAAHAAQLASPERFSVKGKNVLCDGVQFIETIEPEAAQGLVEILNEAIKIDRESRARVTAAVRKDRVDLLSEIIAAPSLKQTRYQGEPPQRWAARAVMAEVDGWL